MKTKEIQQPGDLLAKCYRCVSVQFQVINCEIVCLLWSKLIEAAGVGSGGQTDSYTKVSDPPKSQDRDRDTYARARGSTAS